MGKLTDTVWKLSEGVVKEHGCEIWDVEYVREAGEWYLRIYLDKPDGPIGIDDCEAVSRALDPILDEKDPVPGSYIFEVSSAGAERELKRPSDFERFIGSEIEIKHYQPIDGRKSRVGILRGYDNGAVTVETDGAERTFNKAQIAQVRLHISI